MKFISNTIFSGSVNAANYSVYSAPQTLTNPGVEAGPANGYGYYGTLKNLGINEPSVNLTSIEFPITQVKLGTGEVLTNYTNGVYLRVLRYTDSGWEIINQSNEKIVALGVTTGTFIKWTLKNVSQNFAISNTENIAIVVVPNENDAANTSGHYRYICTRKYANGGNISGRLGTTGSVSVNNYSASFNLGYTEFDNLVNNKELTENYTKRTETQEMLDVLFNPYAIVPVTTNIASGQINNIIYDGEKWLAATMDGIFYSTDMKTWNQTSMKGAMYSILVSSENDQKIYLAGGYAKSAAATPNVGIFKSTDGGMTWYLTDKTTIATWALVKGATHYIAGDLGNNGIWVSTDGSTWTRSSQTTGSIGALYYDSETSTVFAGFCSSTSGITGIFKSTDDGLTWTQCLTTEAADEFYYNINKIGGTLIAGGQRGVVPIYSTDNGATWVRRSDNPDEGAYSFAFYSSTILSDNYLYVLSYGGGHILRTNDGIVWERLGNLSEQGYAIAGSEDALVYGLYTNGIRFQHYPRKIASTDDILGYAGSGSVVTVGGQINLTNTVAASASSFRAIMLADDGSNGEVTVSTDSDWLTADDAGNVNVAKNSATIFNVNESTSITIGTSAESVGTLTVSTNMPNDTIQIEPNIVVTTTDVRPAATTGMQCSGFTYTLASFYGLEQVADNSTISINSVTMTPYNVTSLAEFTNPFYVHIYKLDGSVEFSANQADWGQPIGISKSAVAFTTVGTPKTWEFDNVSITKGDRILIMFKSDNVAALPNVNDVRRNVYIAANRNAEEYLFYYANGTIITSDEASKTGAITLGITCHNMNWLTADPMETTTNNSGNFTISLESGITVPSGTTTDVTVISSTGSFTFIPAIAQ